MERSKGVDRKNAGKWQSERNVKEDLNAHYSHRLQSVEDSGKSQERAGDMDHRLAAFLFV